MSIAGGVGNAPLRAKDVGANTIQIFTKNNNQWSAKPLSPDEIARFAENAGTCNVKVFASHDCYLINLASPQPDIIKKSREAFLDEIARADALSIPCLVFHPGSHMGKGDDEGLKRVVDSLEWAMDRAPESKVTITLETTAGQGTNLGYKFEHLGWIIANVSRPGRMGVCVDTCHIFSAGYLINTEQGCEETFRIFDDTIGLERLRMFHINDSKTPFGSRVDRHEHIGHGSIGLEGFRTLVNDPRFYGTPMILETPKGPEGEEDRINLAVLRKLAGKRGLSRKTS
ncbi:MAG: deoxyribonuclease IV [Nitrospinae bacterium]|nr:deoxyribonuclease IV [Nitrospinota bacterium]